MSLANYTDLQASIASWLDRADQTANIPDFIALAESSINADLRVRDMVKISTMATISGQDYTSLPADWLEFVYIKSGTTPLEWISPDVLRSKATETGDLTYYTIEGDRVLLNPTPGASTLTTAYYARISALSVTPTNSILTKYPQLYLCKAMAWAWQFVMDSAKAAQWEGMYQASLAQARSMDSAAHISGSPLRIRSR